MLHLGPACSPVNKAGSEQGKIVICDRFVDSTLPIKEWSRNLGVEVVEEINRVALQGLVPNLTLFFDNDPEIV